MWENGEERTDPYIPAPDHRRFTTGRPPRAVSRTPSVAAR